MFGVVRAPGRPTRTSRPCASRVELLQADLLDQLSLVRALESCRPHEVYNLASVSFVPASWEQPILTAEFAAVGVTTLLEAIRARRRGDPLLPGVVERDLRRAARDAADRADAALAADAVRRREGVRALHHGQLPAPLRPPRLLGDPLQPRVAAAAARLPAAEGRARRGGDRARARGRAVARRSRRAPRLGLRGRLRARDVADAAAGRAGRLRDRDRRSRTRSRSSSSARSRTSASTGASTSRSTSRCGAARPSCTTSSATRRRPARCSAGRRRSPSRSSCSLLVDAELARLGGQPVELAVDLVVRARARVPGEPGCAGEALRDPLVRRASTSRTASAIAAGSVGSKSRAASPQTSGSDAAFEQATGQPQAIASSGGRPKPS